MRYKIPITLFVVALSLPSPPASSQGIQQVRVRWGAYPALPADVVTAGAQEPSRLFTLLEQRKISGSLARQRNPQLSSDQIVVVAVDEEGRMVDDG